MVRRVLPVVVGLALAASLAPGAALGQRPPAAPRAALVPQVSAGGMAARWGAEDPEARLGPSRAPHFGASLQLRATRSTSVEVLGTIASTGYAIESALTSIRGSGSVHVYRFEAGLLWRMRADVPGYFSIGGGAEYYNPRDRIDVGPVPISEDEAQWMPAAHVGAGLDWDVDGHLLRLDFRLLATQPAQEMVRAVGRQLERRTALDFRIGVGYLIGI